MFPVAVLAFGNCRHSGSLKAGAQEYPRTAVPPEW